MYRGEHAKRITNIKAELSQLVWLEGFCVSLAEAECIGRDDAAQRSLLPTWEKLMAPWGWQAHQGNEGGLF
jgi:hypothetical protein